MEKNNKRIKTIMNYREVRRTQIFYTECNLLLLLLFFYTDENNNAHVELLQIGRDVISTRTEMFRQTRIR